jgi:hypothetical protein
MTPSMFTYTHTHIHKYHLHTHRTRTDVDEKVGLAQERQELVRGGGENPSLDDHLILNFG